MKIAISSMGRDLDALIDPRFGRCAYFVIVDTQVISCFSVVAYAGDDSDAGFHNFIIMDLDVCVTIKGHSYTNARGINKVIMN